MIESRFELLTTDVVVKDIDRIRLEDFLNFLRLVIERYIDPEFFQEGYLLITSSTRDDLWAR